MGQGEGLAVLPGAGVGQGEEEGEGKPQQLQHNDQGPLHSIGCDVTKHSQALPTGSRLCERESEGVSCVRV